MEWNNVAVYAGFTSAANGRIKNLEYETIYYDQGWYWKNEKVKTKNNFSCNFNNDSHWE